MRKPLVALLALTLTLTLSACGTVRESRLNPFNWFGASREVPAQAQESTNPLIPQRRNLLRRPEAEFVGTPLEQVTALSIERVSDGAIVRVQGMAQRADAYDIRLVPQPTERADELHFELQGAFPEMTRSTARLPRPVTVAEHLTTQDLAGIRRIRVSAASNARETRR
ncbi:DUF1131 domain-containing protein [Lutimaribacter sp. EGI FJ00015]|uniref:DUF1131 domain-containing protein n=1 Tax=Lutimaribacter degradans TaxID=2945989 RepID=A0ACC5ZSR6_9RHOB|nr:DUF1131 domain-containing protein [Lutimaribacter sp. EGI FJ00013]MCM2561341.1 DUF1131 domain-containing protein [Lutimaribacter sp. EGI FJ00013]MCO0611708.1 DUF1131 domain-containing protein [Lutimaribacter sp. EGI FJ00015]MCO0635170.1 DUF1131 domain-containing protein [Lutimaribacter sp. EGI FJ00014]